MDEKGESGVSASSLRQMSVSGHFSFSTTLSEHSRVVIPFSGISGSVVLEK